MMEIAPSATVLAEVLLPLALVGLITLFVALSTEQGRLEDLVQRQANQITDTGTDPDVVVVQIDETTRRAFGIGADSRAMINCIVRRLARAQPRVIALDYVFGDQPRVPDLVPGFCVDDGLSLVIPDDVPLVLASMKSHGAGYLQEVPPSPAFADPQRIHFGYAELIEDRQDGTVRTLAVYDTDPLSGEAVPSFALATWLAAMRRADGTPEHPSRPEARDWLGDCASGTASCPGSIHGVQRIRFLPPTRALRLIPAQSLFSSACVDPTATGCPLEMVRDRIVLVGSSHAEASDTFRTPLYSDLPFASFLLASDQDSPMLAGVVVHALAVQNLIDDRGFVRPLPWPLRMVLAVLILALPTLVAMLLRLLVHGARAKGAVALAALVFLATMLGLLWILFHMAVMAMAQWHVLVPLSLLLPLLGLGVLLAVIGLLVVSRAGALASLAFARQYGGRFAEITTKGYADVEARLRRGESVPVVSLLVDLATNGARPEDGNAAAKALMRLERDLLDELDLDAEVASGDALPLQPPSWNNRIALHVVVNESGRGQALSALLAIRDGLGGDGARYRALQPFSSTLVTGALRGLIVRDRQGQRHCALLGPDPDATPVSQTPNPVPASSAPSPSHVEGNQP